MDLFKISTFVKDIGEILQKIVLPFAKSFNESYHTWTENEKNRITEMVKIGWYPNWATFSFILEEDACKTYDEFMIQRIDENFDAIVEEILSFCINRKDILQNAFNLYKEGNYIACIPLFLIQADGICNEEYGYFFTHKNRTEGKASTIITNNHENKEYEFFSDIVIELYKIHKSDKDNKIQLTSRIEHNTIENKKNGANRSGILHGDENHLDYGTKINAYKAFSFLAFIVFSTKDLLSRK